MANQKISDMTAASTPLGGDELVEIVQGGQNRKTTTQDIADLGGGGGIWGSITGTLSNQNDLQAALDAKENEAFTHNTQTGNYVLVLTDKDSTLVEMNVGSANSITVPPNSSVAFPVGTKIPIVQYGAGLTSVVAGVGVTINTSAGSLDSPGQYAPMVLEKRATNEWYLWNGTAGGGGGSGTVTSVDVAVGTSGTDIASTGGPITTSGTITINIPTASASNRGALSTTDWSTFNNKQSAITFGTGVQTSLGVNIGSAGAPVLFNGAGGTPTSITLTNGTGLPISTGVSGLGTGVATFLATPSWTNFNSMITGTAPYWALTGTNTLTGATTITSNTANQLVFNGTFTATANNQYFANWSPTITGRASNPDNVFGTSFTPSITAGANSQVLIGVEIAPTFATGGFSSLTNIALRINTSGIGLRLESSANPILQFSRSGNVVSFEQLSSSLLYFNSRFNVNTGLRIGSTSNPTARLHLPAGTASADTGPLRFETGTLLTTPSDGVVEYNSPNLHFTTNTNVRYILTKGLIGSSTLDFGSVSAGASTELTITVTGAADGDEVALGIPNASFTSGLIFTARVSATDTVSVQCYNSTGSPIDPGSGTFRVTVVKH